MSVRIKVKLDSNETTIVLNQGINYIIGNRGTFKSTILRQINDFFKVKDKTVRFFDGDITSSEIYDLKKAMSKLLSSNENELDYHPSIGEVTIHEINKIFNKEFDVYLLDCVENNLSNNYIFNSLLPKIKRLQDGNAIIVVITYASILVENTEYANLIYPVYKMKEKSIDVYQGHSKEEFLVNDFGDEIRQENVKSLVLDGYKNSPKVNLDNRPEILKQFEIDKLYDNPDDYDTRKLLQKDKLGRYTSELAENEIDLSKLDKNTLSFYGTGSFFYEILVYIDVDFFDFGPCIMCWSRAIENELFIRFKDLIVNDDEMANKVKYNNRTGKMKFTLGSLPYLMKITKFKDSRQFANYYQRLPVQRKKLEALFEILKKVDNLAADYRNASAHKNRIALQKATDCRKMLNTSPIILKFLSNW